MVAATNRQRQTAFQGKDPEEIFHFYFRQHWIRMIGPGVRMLLGSIFLLLMGALIFVVIRVDDPMSRRLVLLFLVLAFLILQFELLARLYRYFLYVIIVTDQRIHRIKKTLIAVDDHQSVDIHALQDIVKNQHGIVQNIFGFGSIILEAQETVLRIHFVPRIQKTCERIMHLREGKRS